MVKLYNEGGPVFMAILTLLALAIVAFSVYTYSKSNVDQNEGVHLRRLRVIKEMGLLSLVFGFFTLCLSFAGMFDAIEAASHVSSAVLAGGLKVMMIPVIYGFILFLFSRLLLVALSWLKRA